MIFIIKHKYGDRAKLLFTDTDSLTYEIETEDVYQDFWKDKDKFDTCNSDYPENSPYFDKTIKNESANSKMNIVQSQSQNSLA